MSRSDDLPSRSARHLFGATFPVFISFTQVLANQHLLERLPVADPGALNHVIALREKTLVPSEHDLHGAAIALVRLQDTYQLNVTHLAEGYFQGVDHSKERGNPFTHYTR